MPTWDQCWLLVGNSSFQCQSQTLDTCSVTSLWVAPVQIFFHAPSPPQTQAHGHTLPLQTTAKQTTAMSPWRGSPCDSHPANQPLISTTESSRSARYINANLTACPGLKPQQPDFCNYQTSEIALASLHQHSMSISIKQIAFKTSTATHYRLYEWMDDGTWSHNHNTIYGIHHSSSVAQWPLSIFTSVLDATSSSEREKSFTPPQELTCQENIQIGLFVQVIDVMWTFFWIFKFIF